jgi:hypothetical protein
MNIDFADTYEMAEGSKRDAFRPDLPNYVDLGRETLREYHRGQRRPLKPLQLAWAEGSRLMDFTGTTAVLPQVISQRFVDVLHANSVTGWSTYPIELRGKDEQLIEGYHGLVVTGKCGPLQDERSRVETRIGKAGGRYTVKLGLFFEEARWDGSDVYTPDDTSFVFVVGKVKRLLEKAKVSNVRFTALDAVERM